MPRICYIISKNNIGGVYMDTIEIEVEEPMDVVSMFLRCPFCNGSNIYAERMSIDKVINYFCVCGSCGCEGPNYPNKEASINLWNTRALNVYTGK
jgi:hypothetical protein